MRRFDPSSSEPVALRLRDIGKTYPGGTQALTGVDLTLERGEIHALVGENGAGKTTLASIAAGTLRATTGEREAAGTVGFVHQHFELVERLHVWENIVLGREPRRGPFVDANAARAAVRSLGERFGLPVDPDAPVAELPVGIAQRVELLRELARTPAALLLDEPTAALAPGEIAALLQTLRALAASGMAILIVTHKLQEVLDCSDRVTVMRAGRVVARFVTAETSLAEIAHAMVGRALPPLAERTPTAQAPMFAVRELHAGDGAQALDDVSFSVRTGEIVGIAGVEGNGQSSLADAIAGTIPYEGTLELRGRALRPADPQQRLRAGIRVIPQDRLREALVPSWSIVDNLTLGAQRSERLRAGWNIDRREARKRAREVIEHFALRPATAETPVPALSGGNQQKVVVGRAMLDTPRLLLAYQPTRGIDIGAATLVHSALIEARNRGCAVLLISFELDEILALADRVAVIFRGSLVAWFEHGAFDRARIGELMAGATRAQ